MRFTSPSLSKPRRVKVSIRWDMPGMWCIRALKRTTRCSDRQPTTNTVHLSPMRSMICARGQAGGGDSPFSRSFFFPAKPTEVRPNFGCSVWRSGIVQISHMHTGVPGEQPCTFLRNHITISNIVMHQKCAKDKMFVKGVRKNL